MKLKKVKNLNITAGGTYTVDVFSANDYIYLVSGGVTLSSNLVIAHNPPSMGLQNGLQFDIFYDGTLITFGSYTCTVFGTLMPSDLRNKKVLITVYSDGSTYKVIFNSDFSTILSLINNNNIVYHDGTTGTSSTTGIVGAESLRSFSFSNPCNSAGDRLIVKMGGTFSSANTKGILITINDGTNTRSIFNSNTTDQNSFIVEIELICTDYSNGYYKLMGRRDTNTNTYILSLGNQTATPILFNAATFTIDVYGTEFTPSGGQISIHSLSVTKSLF